MNIEEPTQIIFEIFDITTYKPKKFLAEFTALCEKHAVKLETKTGGMFDSAYNLEYQISY